MKNAEQMRIAIASFLYAFDRGYFEDGALMVGPADDRSESAFVTGLRNAIEEDC
jgi:hypothetical protein